MSKKELRKPVNTTQRINDDPMAFLAEAMVFGGSEAIERSESRGQQDFVDSDTLPTDINPADKLSLERLGFKFIGPVEGDPLFQYVEFPDGWTKQPTDHAMWSNLVDNKGRKRGGIFYKAAFYDRSAHLSLNCRYGIRADYDRQDKEGVWCDNVVDGETVIHTTEPLKLQDGMKRFELSDKSRASAVSWLNQKYPDWRLPDAYWD